MKIGIFNIFKFSALIIVIAGLGILNFLFLFNFKTFFCTEYNFDFIVLIAFFIIVFLISLVVFFYFIKKIRILIIRKQRIIIVYPFMLKTNFFSYNEIKDLKLGIESDANGTFYRNIKILHKNGEIILSTFEFENFDNLISELNYDKNKMTELKLEEANENLSDINFIIIMNIFFLAFLLIILYFLNLNWFIISTAILSFIFLITAINRVRNYRKIIRKNT